MFEYNFVRLGIANWYTAPMIARFIIALELAFGAMLLFQLHLHKRTLKATLVLLILFTIYLLVQLINEGNRGNCGCFGTYLEMTPLESIIKNLMMMGVIVWLLLTEADELTFLKNHRFIRDTLIYVILGVSLAAPFVLNTPEFIVQKQFDKNSKHYALDLSKLYQEDSHNPQVDLRKGKHILSLMSLRCEHCKTAAFKMSVMHKRHPEIPFFNLYKGNPEKYLQSFFEYTHAEDIPYMITTPMTL